MSRMDSSLQRSLESSRASIEAAEASFESVLLRMQVRCLPSVHCSLCSALPSLSGFHCFGFAPHSCRRNCAALYTTLLLYARVLQVVFILGGFVKSIDKFLCIVVCPHSSTMCIT